jgi:hypothetical protein
MKEIVFFSKLRQKLSLIGYQRLFYPSPKIVLEFNFYNFRSRDLLLVVSVAKITLSPIALNVRFGQNLYFLKKFSVLHPMTRRKVKTTAVPVTTKAMKDRRNPKSDKSKSLPRKRLERKRNEPKHQVIYQNTLCQAVHNYVTFFDPVQTHELE